MFTQDPDGHTYIVLTNHLTETDFVKQGVTQRHEVDTGTRSDCSLLHNNQSLLFITYELVSLIQIALLEEAETNHGR